jgi:hypothetical protein
MASMREFCPISWLVAIRLPRCSLGCEERGRRETQPSAIMNVKNVATISTRYISSPTDMAHLVVSVVMNKHEGMTEIAL